MNAADWIVYYAGLFCYGALLGSLWGTGMYPFDPDEIKRSEASYEQERADSASVVRGLMIGVAVMLAFAYLVYRVMSWYLSTMPPLRLH